MEILQNGFCMIPNVVLYDTELSDKQKLLYGVISSLCAEKGYCRASNEYIGELLDADKRTISRNISELYERGYIEVNIDSYNKRYIELNSIVEDRQKCLGGIDKNVQGDSQKCLHININNKNKENIINNNTEQSSEIKNPTQLNSLSLNSLEKEKEKSSAKKEKEITTEINNLISQIKQLCDVLGVAYNKDMERQFAKHILTAKEFGEFCEKIGQSRIEFALNVLKVSVGINFYRGALSGPKLIYKHYAELYNQAKQKSPKLQTPTIQVI